VKAGKRQRIVKMATFDQNKLKTLKVIKNTIFDQKHSKQPGNPKNSGNKRVYF